MTDTLEADPFAADPIQRDQYGRPLIIPIKKRGGQPDLKAKLIGYTRVSTFASSISDPGGLIKHSERHTALGLGRDENLAAMVGVFGPTLADCSRVDKIEIDRIIELAKQRSGGYVKANHGTAVHGMTEPDRDPFVPARMTADVESYHKALADHGIEVVSTEQFVVCDELQVAGTFDHLYRLTRDITFDNGVTLCAGQMLIGDKKTGALHFDSQSIQLAIYAQGKLYNPETGERTNHGGVVLYGLLTHIPKGEGRTDLYLIDLRKGWAAARLAGSVRAHRTDKALGQQFPKPVRIIESADPESLGINPDRLWPIGSDVRTVEVEPGVVVPALDDVSDEEVKRRYREFKQAPRLEPNPFGGPVIPAEPENPAVVESATAAVPSAPTPTLDAIAEKAAEKKRDIFAECAATEAAIKARREEVAAAEAVSIDADEAAVMAALNDIGAVPIVKPIFQRLNEATSRDELAQVWHDAKAEGFEWTAAHTAVLQSRAKTIAEAAS